MIDKQKLSDVVEQAIQNTDLFVVNIAVTPANDITVTVDSPTGVDIDQCVAISHAVEQAFPRDDDAEDYSLEVGSAGVTAPFTVMQQYRMNVGNPVTVLTADGRKMHATLAAVADDDSTVTLAVERKIKEPGAKRPVLRTVEETVPVADIRRIEREIVF